MPTIKVVNLETGEEIEREMNAEEAAQKAKDEQTHQAVIKAKLEAQLKREAALAKLATIGLNEDDLKVLGI